MNEYISDNYNKFLEFANNIKHYNLTEDPRDILQECIMYMLEFPKEKQDIMLEKGYVAWYLIRMITLSYTENSKYQQKYNKIKYSKFLNEEIKEEENEEIDLYDIRLKLLYDILITKCTFYEQQVFIQYNFKHKTFANFSESTGITISSLWKTYQKVLKIIDENLYLLKNN